MNKVAQRIVEILIKHKFLNENRKEEYGYVVEILLEKTISFGTLIMLSLLFNNILQTITFLFTFMNMRGRTGGFHMRSYGGCWLSTVILYAVLVIMMPIFSEMWGYTYLLFTIAIFVILIISTVNHPNMGLSDLEYTEAKKVARLTAGIHWIFITVLLLWSSIFVTLMANKIGGLQFGIYRNCQISSRVFHTAVAALPLTKANRSDFE